MIFFAFPYKFGIDYYFKESNFVAWLIIVSISGGPCGWIPGVTDEPCSKFCTSLHDGAGLEFGAGFDALPVVYRLMWRKDASGRAAELAGSMSLELNS